MEYAIGEMIAPHGAFPENGIPMQAQRGQRMVIPHDKILKVLIQRREGEFQ
jgi:hypothetical protein